MGAIQGHRPEGEAALLTAVLVINGSVPYAAFGASPSPGREEAITTLPCGAWGGIEQGRPWQSEKDP